MGKNEGKVRNKRGERENEEDGVAERSRSRRNFRLEGKPDLPDSRAPRTAPLFDIDEE